jgi:hypothetical protein
MDGVEKQFDAAMMNIYVRAKNEAGYTASIFHQMLVKRRGRATAKALINAPKDSEGYEALYERGFLHLTVEAVVVENLRWHPLFDPDEIEKARKRLIAYGYTPKEPS